MTKRVRTFGEAVVTRDANILHLSSIFTSEERTSYGTFSNLGPKVDFMKLFISDLGEVCSSTTLNGSLNEITLIFYSSI